jgi:hypothetical protein
MENRFKTFIFQYHHDGGNWLLEIKAPSLDDAQARILKLPHAKPVGELVAKIPTMAGMGFIARAICWLRNSLAMYRV